MSDVMLLGVLRMPYEMAMSDDLSRIQFHGRAQQAADRIEADGERIAQLQQRIAEMEADAERFKCLVETSPRALCFLGKDYYSVDEFRNAIDDHIASTITEGDKNERN